VVEDDMASLLVGEGLILHTSVTIGYDVPWRKVHELLIEAGVEIMSPHFTQLRDGNKAAIPDAYLPPGYEPRSIRVASVQEEKEKPGG
jgi:hypothetical protein